MILIISRWHCQPALLSFSQLGLSWSKNRNRCPSRDQSALSISLRMATFHERDRCHIYSQLTGHIAAARMSRDQNNTWSRTGCQSNQTRCSSSTPPTSSLPVHVSNWRFGLPWPLTLHRNRKDVAADHVADLVTNLKRYSLNTMVSSQFFYTK